MPPTTACDIYSFGLIMHEIAYQMGPAYVEQLAKLFSNGSVSEAPHESEDLAVAVIKRRRTAAIIPTIPRTSHHNKKLKTLEDVMRTCWAQDPSKRPKIQQILHAIQVYTHKEKIDVVFDVGKRLTEASKQVVTQLEEQMMDVMTERDRAFKYLANFLPPNLCYEFLTGGTQKRPEHHQNVTIYFNYLKNFSNLAQENTMKDVMNMLNELCLAYDKLLKSYDAIPMHRVGVSLMICSGVPHANSEHTSEVAQVALQMREVTLAVKKMELQAASGMHSGEIMSGVVGKHIPQFGVFGDAVNTASRMASTCPVNEIQMSEAARDALWSISTHFDIQPVGLKEIKGLGRMNTYLLKGYDEYRDTSIPLTGRVDRNVAPRHISFEEHISQKSRKQTVDPTGVVSLFGGRSPFVHSVTPRNVKMYGSTKKNVKKSSTSPSTPVSPSPKVSSSPVDRKEKSSIMSKSSSSHYKKSLPSSGGDSMIHSHYHALSSFLGKKSAGRTGVARKK